MVTENLCFAASHAPALQDFLVLRFGLDGSVSTLFAHLAILLAIVACFAVLRVKTLSVYRSKTHRSRRWPLCRSCEHHCESCVGLIHMIHQCTEQLRMSRMSRRRFCWFVCCGFPVFAEVQLLLGAVRHRLAFELEWWRRGQQCPVQQETQTRPVS